MAERKIRIELRAIIAILGDQLYSKAQVFIRENVQNAIDANRMIKIDKRSEKSRVQVTVNSDCSEIVVEDWGIGMSEYDLELYYWSVGGSYKKDNIQAIECGVIGKFGVGAFANFGVCESVEVESWRKECQKVQSKILKSDLNNGIDDYHITSIASINHYGTRIIAKIEKNKNIKVDELKKYLSDHIEYVDEEIYFNNTILSQKKFPTFKLDITKPLYSGVIKLGDLPISVIFIHNSISEKLHIKLESKNLEHTFSGSLTAESDGILKIYNNKFLVEPGFKMYGIIEFSGHINTSLLEPNVAREGLEKKSVSFLEKFLRDLSLITSKVVGEKNLLQKFSNIENHIVQKLRWGYAEYEALISYLCVEVYGDKNKYMIQEIEKKFESKGIKVFTSLTREIPARIRPLAIKQDILVILEDNASADKRNVVNNYLLQKTNSKEISRFELEAVILDENQLSQEQKGVKAGIHNALYSIHYLNDFEVILCEADSFYKIYLEDRKGKINILVNTQSDIFNDLQKQVNQSHFKFLVNNALITPYLSDALKDYVPTDISQMNREISERTKLEKVTDINLIIGSNWKGPTANCIKVTSKVFPNMEGYYIKIPDKITEQIRPVLASCDPPKLHWANEILFANSYSNAKLLTIRIEVLGLLTSINGELFGNALNKRRIEVFDTGAYLPIPIPPLEDIIPFKDHVDLMFTHKFYSIR